ncbi:hypothetical protein KBA73_03945 [Patescibacteria group bacterium]|nr:hypothetical protein [Patescibacteria group bacterium]
MKWFALFLGLAILCLSGCAPGPNTAMNVNMAVNGGVTQHFHVAGFWLGLWHGMIAPITFLVSLLQSDVNVYEVHNNGGWYNLGFVVGAGILFGGSGGGVRVSARSRSDD